MILVYGTNTCGCVPSKAEALMKVGVQAKEEMTSRAEFFEKTDNR